MQKQINRLIPRNIADRLKTHLQSLLHAGYWTIDGMKGTESYVRMLHRNAPNDEFRAEAKQCLKAIDKDLDIVKHRLAALAASQKALKQYIQGRKNFSHSEIQRLERIVSRMIVTAESKKRIAALAQVQWHIRKQKAQY